MLASNLFIGRKIDNIRQRKSLSWHSRDFHRNVWRSISAWRKREHFELRTTFSKNTYFIYRNFHFYRCRSQRTRMWLTHMYSWIRVLEQVVIYSVLTERAAFIWTHFEIQMVCIYCVRTYHFQLHENLNHKCFGVPLNYGKGTWLTSSRDQLIFNRIINDIFEPLRFGHFAIPIIHNLHIPNRILRLCLCVFWALKTRVALSEWRQCNREKV